MRSYELIRRVSHGPLTILLRIAANAGPCEICQEAADEKALIVSTLADEDDDPMVLADKIARHIKGIQSVEVTDSEGSGACVVTALDDYEEPAE